MTSVWPTFSRTGLLFYCGASGLGLYTVQGHSSVLGEYGGKHADHSTVSGSLVPLSAELEVMHCSFP